MGLDRNMMPSTESIIQWNVELEHSGVDLLNNAVDTFTRVKCYESKKDNFLERGWYRGL